MFGPDQTQRLKRAAASNPSIANFESQTISTRTISVENNDTAMPSISEAEIGVLYPPATVIGTPFDQSCLDGIGNWPITAPRPIFTHVSNARIIGSRSVLGERGDLYIPQHIRTSIELERAIDENSNGYDGFAIERGADNMLRCYFGSRPRPRRILKSAIFLHNLEPGNFGSFMFRLLPKMFYLKDIGLNADCYVTGSRTSWFQEAMEMLELPKRPVFTVREVCGETFNEIHIPNDFDAEGFMNSDGNRGFEFLRDRCTDWGSAPERIYVSRALSGVGRREYRLMDNELEVEKYMHDRGFEIVYPETLTFRQQISVFRSARYIVGPSGSAMFNSAFSPRGARIVDIETYHNTVRQHAKFYSSQRHVYAFAFADFDFADTRHPITRTYNMPLDRLETAVDWALTH